VADRPRLLSSHSMGRAAAAASLVDILRLRGDGDAADNTDGSAGGDGASLCVVGKHAEDAADADNNEDTNDDATVVQGTQHPLLHTGTSWEAFLMDADDAEEEEDTPPSLLLLDGTAAAVMTAFGPWVAPP